MVRGHTHLPPQPHTRTHTQTINAVSSGKWKFIKELRVSKDLSLRRALPQLIYSALISNALPIEADIALS